MPLRLNVGATRKVTDHNYGSRGASVHLDVELDSGLATDTEKLQERIRQLFTMVHQSLDQELAAQREDSSKTPAVPAEKNPHRDPESNGKPTPAAPRPASAAQIKALYAIVKKSKFDLQALIRERFGLDRPEQCTIRQASELIDTLKSMRSPSAAQ
jgi:hypothetical protein